MRYAIALLAGASLLLSDATSADASPIVLTLDAVTGGPSVTPVLASGQTYLIEVSGTYQYVGETPDDPRRADAEFSNPDGPWVEYHLGFVDPLDVLDVLIDETRVDWLGSADGIGFASHTFSPDHRYRLFIIGGGAPVSVRIYDSSYDWNAGSLTATVTELEPVPEPMTLVLFASGAAVIMTRRRRRRT